MRSTQWAEAYTRRPQWHNNGSLTALGGMCLAMWRSMIKTPHYDHTTRAHRHTVPGHLPPPVRLGLGELNNG
eukprot:scaffold8041_cov122-Isochrysis_galbana.AAC.3